MENKETTFKFGAGRPPLRPKPTLEDLARSIEALDNTLSEVLVLLYHVVQTNQMFVEHLREQQRSEEATTRVTPVLYGSWERTSRQ